MPAAEVVAYLRANIDDFTAKMGEAKAEMKDVGDSGSSNLSKLGTVGKFALLGIGAAAVGVGIASIDLADKYQAATNTIAANGDISIAKANEIGKAFLGTAGTTIYSAQNIASAFGAVAGQVKLMNGGVLNAKAAMDVMRPAMDLAEASGDNLNNATSDITATLQAFGLKITQSPLVSNVLFNAARVTGTSVDALSNQLDKMKAKMGDTAPPIGQMGGLLVDLTEHGETGRAAMTALGSAFTGIVSPTTAVANAQKLMGVSFTNANGQLLPMKQIIGELSPALDKMGNAQAAATLKSLGFGSAATKLVGVIQAGPAAFDAATAAVTRQNSAHEAAEKQAQTLQHQVELVKATVEDYGVSIGQALIPKLEALLKAGLAVGEWLGQHKVALIAVATVISGVLATAIGAYVVLTGVKFVKATMDAAEAVGKLGKGVVEFAGHLKNEISWAAEDASGAFQRLSQGASTFGEHLKNEITWAVEDAKKLASSIAETAASAARSFASMAASAAKWVAETAVSTAKWVAENIAKVATVVATNVAAAASTAAAWIAANAAMILATGGIILAIGALILIVVEIVKHWGAVKEFFKKLWADVKVAFDDAWGFIKTLLLNLTPEGLIYEHWRGIVTFFENLWSAVSSGIVTAWNAIVSFFTTIPAKIIGALLSFNSLLLHWASVAWEQFTSYISTAWDNEIAFWKAIPAKVINAVSSFGGLILNWITVAWNTFKSWIESAWNNEVAFWTTIPQKLINAVINFASMLATWIINAWNSFNSAAISAFGTVLSWFEGIPHAILNALGDATSWLYNVGKNIIQGIINGLSDAEQFVLNKIKSIGSDITGAFKSVLGIFSPSTVFYEHGRNIMQGLANGMVDSSSLATNAINKIAGQISGQSFGATGTYNAGISPISGSTAAAAGGSSTPIYLQVNGQTFATLMLPSLQTAVLQAQRGSSVPIFGSPQ